MKRFLLSFVMTVLCMAGLYAQAPKGFNYQAVIRNSSGALMENRYVGIRISIRQYTPDGAVVYQYADHLQTNANGLLTVTVGANSQQYDSINWGDGPYYLISEIDPEAGYDYRLVTTQQILSVPYSEYARVADHVSSAFTYDEIDPLFAAWGYEYDSLRNAPTHLSQFVNDLTLSISGDTLFMGNDQWVSLSSYISPVLYWDSIIGRPLNLSDFVNDLALSQFVNDMSLSQFSNDLTLLFRGDTLYVGDSAFWLGSLTTTTLDWSSLTGVPTNLSQFNNDLQLRVHGDTLFLTGDVSQYVLLDTLTSHVYWDSIVDHPTNLTDFVDDLPVSLQGDTIHVGAHIIAIDTLGTHVYWDSIIGHRDSLSMFVDDLPVSLQGDTIHVGVHTIAIDTLGTHVYWDSIIAHPTNLTEFVDDLPVSLQGDTIHIGVHTIAIDTLGTHVYWDSIIAHPTNLTEFVDDLPVSLQGDTIHIGVHTIAIDTLGTHVYWDSIIGHPTSLTGLVDDLPVSLQGDTIHVGVHTIAIDTLGTHVYWDSIIAHPTNLTDFVDDLPVSLQGDTIHVGAHTIAIDTLGTHVYWDSIIAHPTNLTEFVDDLPVSLQGDTIHVGVHTIAIDTLGTHVYWDSIIAHPTNLTEFVDDLPVSLQGDTIHVGVHTIAIDTLGTHVYWDSIIAHPTKLSDFNNDIVIQWDSVVNRPTRLSKFINDITIQWDSIAGRPDSLFIDADTVLYFGTNRMFSVDLRRLVRHSVFWDSVTDRPTRLGQFTNDITIPWDSVTNRPTSISQFVDDMTVLINGDTLYVGTHKVAIDTLYSHVYWDSIIKAPSKLSYFDNDLQPTIVGDTLRIGSNRYALLPSRLSQFTNDLILRLGAGDTLYVGDSTQKICLRPLRTQSLPWDKITYHPDSLSQFHNDLVLRFYNDTLYLIGDTAVSVSLRSLRTTTIPWSQVTGAPQNLSNFYNDLHLNPVFQNDTLYFIFPTTTDTIDLKPLRVTTLPWESIVGRPTTLSSPKLVDDMENIKINDTLFLHNRKDTILLHRSSLYTHWDSVVARPHWVDTAHYAGTTADSMHIHNLVNPTLATDAANKRYVDAKLAQRDARIDSLQNVIDSLADAISALQHPVIEGMLPGVFSVSATKQVVFSQGNLQYNPSMAIFRFAEHQYDYVKYDNNSADLEDAGTLWLDLFGYGTSTWNGGRGRCYMPYSTNGNNEQYMVDRVSGNDLTGVYANCDWGRYNSIVNGSNQQSNWRTLTKDEWNYILNYRNNCASLKTMARVNGKDGLLLLPDNWTAPAGITITPNMTLGSENYFSLAQWTAMEAAGAVFLPVAGYRIQSATTFDNITGYYWSASHVNDSPTHSTALQIRTDTGLSLPATQCSQACSVRLVRDY